ncbi:MAG: RDD family protein [Brachybacterium sp.]|nr:RDD family protein [Brachybacterium sp.]
MSSLGLPSSDRDDLVTGEAVLLDLPAASFGTRALSFLIDGATQLLVLVGGTVAFAVLAERMGFAEGFVAAGSLLISLVAFIAIPVLSEFLLDGRSLGRLALGTRVVREDGGPVHLRQSILRAVMAMFEIWATSGAIALVASLVDRRSRRLGDLIAGTFVIQERLRAPLPVREEVPEALRSWAQGADVGRLPPRLLSEVRAFLPRASSLASDSRRQIAVDLLEQVVPLVAPPPPPGTDPEMFLRAVLAERSRRDEALLRRRAERQERIAAQARHLPFQATEGVSDRG